MSVLYIKEQGSIVKKRGERIVVSKNDMELLEIAVSNLENIAVIGNVQITTQSLHMLMEAGVSVFYFSYSGKIYGRMLADRSKNIFLRFSQYDLYRQEEMRLRFARKIVYNKINNQICLMERHRFKNKEYNLKADVTRMKELRDKLEKKNNSSEIMGIEGICSNIYFGAFSHMFHCDFEFHERNRRPPRDPINILISLGYTFLEKEVSAALEAESFEMYLGLLHGIRYGRKSLALDIMEEFRQPIIDHFIVIMCNKRVFNQYDFEREDEIVLNEEGFKKFCKEFEKWMTHENKVNYRVIIKRQAALLKKAIMKGEEYLPYCMEEEENVSDKL